MSATGHAWDLDLQGLGEELRSRAAVGFFEHITCCGVHSVWILVCSVGLHVAFSREAEEQLSHPQDNPARTQPAERTDYRALATRSLFSFVGLGSFFLSYATYRYFQVYSNLLKDMFVPNVRYQCSHAVRRLLDPFLSLLIICVAYSGIVFVVTVSGVLTGGALYTLLVDRGPVSAVEGNAVPAAAKWAANLPNKPAQVTAAGTSHVKPTPGPQNANVSKTA